jgi:hypothetical protein
MSAAAFAYVLVLRRSKLENELISLLSHERRAEVQAILEKTRAMPPTEIRLQLKQLRDEHLKRQRESAGNRIDLQLDRMSPQLRTWLTRPF